MYHPIKIHHLSDNQKRKLVKGHPVRVTKGNHHTIHLSEQQHKKLHRAHMNGKKSTVQMDPYQAEQHGSGVMGDLFTKAHNLYNQHKENPFLKPVIRHVKNVAHRGINHLKNRANEYADRAHEYVGEGMRHHKGHGLFGKVGSIVGSKYGPIGSIVGDFAGNMIDKKIGSGMRKHSRLGRKKKHSIGGKLRKHSRMSRSRSMTGRSLMPAGY